MQLASQHPYAEQFIGEPYVYTIDIRNLNDVKETVNTILKNNKVKGQKSKKKLLLLLLLLLLFFKYSIILYCLTRL